jgi:hypothetical protein
MKRLLLAAIVAMVASGPAWAQTNRSLGPKIMNDPGPGSTIAIAGGLNLGHVFTGTVAATQGTAAAGSLANGISTNIGAGFAATSPAGSLSTGLGASAGQSNSTSGAVSFGNGAAITGGVSNDVGGAVGGGFANVLP